MPKIDPRIAPELTHLEVEHRGIEVQRSMHLVGPDEGLQRLRIVEIRGHCVANISSLGQEISGSRR
jgi:hypothetical protein